MSSGQKLNFVSLIRPNDRKKMPWKNGRGVTEEIAIEPNDSKVEDSVFLWRLSSAEITEVSPFSKFSGYDRLLTIIEGKGLELNLGLEEKLLQEGKVLRFSGDIEVNAEPVNGKIKDLNLIFRRGMVKAQMTHVPFGGKPRSFELHANTIFLFAQSGKFKISAYPGEIQNDLSKGEFLRIDELENAGEAKERLVLIEPLAEKSSLIAIEMNWLVYPESLQP